MRIGIDCRLWNETGVGRYTRNLVASLAKIDKKNSYILFFREEEYNNVVLPGENFEKYKAAMRWHTIKEQIYLPFLLKKHKLDLVHFPYFSVPIHYRGKFVVTIHDLILDHFDTGEASTLPWIVYKAKRLAYKYIIKETVAKAKKIIAVSQATKQEILDHLPISKDKVSVIYEGVEEGSKRKEMSTLPEKFKDKKYFLYVGNAYPHKNLTRLIETFSLLLEEKENRDVHFVFVGKEDYFYQKLKEFVKQIGIEKSITFYGHVSDEELTLLYKNAEALIAPSLMEGFGLPGLEAMKQQCLVAASDIPAFREVYGDGAIYFDPMTIPVIKQTLTDILSIDKTVRSQYSKAGLLQSEKFSWEKMAKETLALYHTLSDGKK